MFSHIQNTTNQKISNNLVVYSDASPTADRISPENRISGGECYPAVSAASPAHNGFSSLLPTDVFSMISDCFQFSDVSLSRALLETLFFVCPGCAFSRKWLDVQKEMEVSQGSCGH